MIDQAQLKAVLAAYKKAFIPKQWVDEKYKWEAVKRFQDNWDIKAPNFAEMLNRSLELTDNLLRSVNTFPRAMIEGFAKSAPEQVRSMFIALFDETKDVFERMTAFKSQAGEMLEKYGEGAAQHYQYENAISIYLWLRYPDKYYIYKYSEVKAVAEELHTDYRFKKGAYADNIRSFIKLYDELNAAIKEDSELVSLMKSQLKSNCYPDPELRTLTTDVGFYISRTYSTVDKAVEVETNQGPDVVIDPAAVRRWIYAPGEKAIFWDNHYNDGVMAIGWDKLGDLSVYKDKDELLNKMSALYTRQSTPSNDLLANWQFANDIHPGDIVYAKRGRSVILGRGVVESEYEYDPARNDYCSIHRVNWTDKGAWKLDQVVPMKTLTDITNNQDLIGKIDNAIDGTAPLSDFDETDPDLFSEDWWPSIEEYTPGFSKEQWLTLLSNKRIIGPVWGGALAAFYEAGGSATCSQIAQKYNKSASSISGNCTQLAKRIHKETNCPLSIREDGRNRYWPILFQGKKAGADISGGYLWKLRPELQEALTEFDIMRYRWKGTGTNPSGKSAIHYWWLNANPKIWSFSNIGVGEAQSYTLYNENGNKRRVFQNFLDAKAGDMVIGYESNPVKRIVAIGKVLAEQDGEKLLFEKVEGLTSPIDYSALKECPELENMEYFQNPQGSLFKLTEEEYTFILDLIREENPVSPDASVDAYTKSTFLGEVYMTEKRYDNLVAVLRNKKNIILQGAPGVGKTFAARRLAWSMMGEKDNGRIELVQFHQNYSYEDFMMGYKPVDDGFELKYGIFFRFCQKAANQPDKDFFFIIDEINRGNMSKIFGELLMLIEKDYRGTKATLAYNGLSFAVPKNLYIIGMMNTADRSLAMIDYALRRRFSFFEMEPGFDSEGFIRYQNSLNSETLNELVNKVKDLNQAISHDKSLGKGFCIGHSYFCGRDVCTEEWLHSIVDYDILPMLREYWFDDNSKLQSWENILQGVFQ